jgi:epoxyqueuosine reductase QueG
MKVQQIAVWNAANLQDFSTPRDETSQGFPFCGTCMRCVEVCPAKALKGNAWYPGIPREEILDIRACDRWKKNTTFNTTKDIIVESAPRSAPMD